MKQFYTAVIQMVSGMVVEANLARAECLLKKAASHGAKLVVLPECFAFMGSREEQFVLGRGEAFNGPIRLAVSKMAKKYGVYLVAGTIPVSDHVDDPRPYAASFLYDDQGQEIARYNKIHLFDASVDDAHQGYKESATYRPGESVVCVDTPLGRIGLTVCYDLRFPELFRLLFQQKVDILVSPSAFTKVTGKAHWMTLLKARAIENQCYMIAANQGGKHSPTRETYGHSAIVSPWGELLGMVDKGEGVAMAVFDASELETLRQQMPLAEHQRFFIPSI